jgi:hypothetical protein
MNNYIEPSHYYLIYIYKEMSEKGSRRNPGKPEGFRGKPKGGFCSRLSALVLGNQLPSREALYTL